MKIFHVGSHQFNRSGSCSENCGFRIAQVVRCHSENGIRIQRMTEFRELLRECPRTELPALAPNSLHKNGWVFAHLFCHSQILQTRPAIHLNFHFGAFGSSLIRGGGGAASKTNKTPPLDAREPLTQGIPQSINSRTAISEPRKTPAQKDPAVLKYYAQ